MVMNQVNPFSNNNDHSSFFIVRHGETEWNVKGLMQGHKDSPLTDRGIQQAKHLAQELKNISFDIIFSSDLPRAKRTAQIITLERKLALKTSELLRERNFGQFEGKHKSSLKDFDTIFESLSNQEKYFYKSAPDIESDEELVGRFITFIREVAISYPKNTVLLVSHGGMIQALLIHLGFATYDTMHHSSVSHASYIKLLSDGIEFFIEKTKGIILHTESRK